MEQSDGSSKDGLGTEVRIGADDARSGFGELIDRAWDGERSIVTKHGRERAVVVGWRQYLELVECERAFAVLRETNDEFAAVDALLALRAERGL